MLEGRPRCPPAGLLPPKLPPFDPEDVFDVQGFPWDFMVRAPGAEGTEHFELLRRAGRQPFVRPARAEASTGCRRLLIAASSEFTHNESAVFFGRGRAVSVRSMTSSPRPASRPVILYAGPTGVGKSSVLDAGLMPRLIRLATR